MVLVVGAAALATEGSARTQVVKDGKDLRYVAYSDLDVKKVSVTQTADRRMRFTIVYRRAVRRSDDDGFGSVLELRSRRRMYMVLRGWNYQANAGYEPSSTNTPVVRVTLKKGRIVARRKTGNAAISRTLKKDVFTFPLSAIGDPSSFRWSAGAFAGAEGGDWVPGGPESSMHYYSTFKVAPKDPPKSGGPALRGPSTVKPGKSATYRAFWFTSGSPLTVTLQSKTALGSDREKATITEPVFTAKAGGKTNLKFKFPRTYLPASCGDKSAADCRKKWKPGSEVAVTVCGPPDPPAKVQCARKTSKIFKPKPPKLPVKTIRFRGGKGLMTLRCPQSKKCQGTIEVDHGKSTLVKRQKYTIAAHGKKRLKLRLTKAGRKILAKSRRVHAIGTLTGKSGKKARFVAILRRG